MKDIDEYIKDSPIEIREVKPKRDYEEYEAD